jgi:hypothetical protein
MKKTSILSLAVLSLLLAVASQAGEAAPVSPAGVSTVTATAQEPVWLFGDEGGEVVYGRGQCSARQTCSDGCVITCGGSNICEVGNGFVRCDGRTFTCSGPRICPF